MYIGTNLPPAEQVSGMGKGHFWVEKRKKIQFSTQTRVVVVVVVVLRGVGWGVGLPRRFTKCTGWYIRAFEFRGGNSPRCLSTDGGET